MGLWWQLWGWCHPWGDGGGGSGDGGTHGNEVGGTFRDGVTYGVMEVATLGVVVAPLGMVAPMGQ